MPQDSYRPLALVPSTGDEEDDAALTPSHRGYSVDADCLEAGEDSKVPIGGGASSVRILGEVATQQARIRTLGEKDASSRRIQYLPLVSRREPPLTWHTGLGCARSTPAGLSYMIKCILGDSLSNF
jgi:hypothetical protein